SRLSSVCTSVFESSRQVKSKRSPRAPPRGLPGNAEGPRVGEAPDCFLDAFLVAQAGILYTAEGRQLQSISRHIAHIDASDMKLGDGPGDVVEPVGADRRRQPEGGPIGDPGRRPL